jgi:hypothetical protein
VFIVMSARATEAEVNAVKGVILAEGLQPHVSPGSERIVIALVGDVGSRRQTLISRFESMPGVEQVTPSPGPARQREFHPEDTAEAISRPGCRSLTVMAGHARSSREVALETPLPLRRRELGSCGWRLPPRTARTSRAASGPATWPRPASDRAGHRGHVGSRSRATPTSSRSARNMQNYRR